MIGNYIPLDLRTLRLGSALPFDFYIRYGQEWVLYRHRELLFTADTVNGLRLNNVETLYVQARDAQELARYCEQHFRSILADERVPHREKAQVAHLVTQRLATDVLRRPDRSTVGRAAGSIEALATFVLELPAAVSQLIGVVGDGSTLEEHSANTAIFATALASQLPDSTVVETAKAAMAGLLHDVGMTLVPSHILQKPEPLTAAERRGVERHPVIGEEIVRDVMDMPRCEDVVGAVRSHHERLDGSGYPDGLLADDIPWLVRVVSIAEVFDALTNTTPYRDRVPPRDALELMLNEMAGQLDTALVRTFIPALLSEAKGADRQIYPAL